MHVVHEKDTAAQARQSGLHRSAVEFPARRRTLEAVQHARLVPLGLETADEPCAGVGKRLVVEIHGILRGEHDADAETHAPA